MEYIVIIFLIILSIYPYNYAKYLISKKNKAGAAGVYFLILLQILYPALLLFLR